MNTVLLVLVDNRLLLNHMAASLMNRCSFVLAYVNDFLVYIASVISKDIDEGIIYVLRGIINKD